MEGYPIVVVHLSNCNCTVPSKHTFSKIMKEKNPTPLIRDSLRIIGIRRSITVNFG
jgi:hypothetical protein